METKRDTVEGYIFESGNGQIVIDLHETDEQHLLAQATHNEQPLHRCRQYIRDLIPKEWRGKKGKVFIDRQVGDNGEVFAVQLSFVPAK